MTNYMKEIFDAVPAFANALTDLTNPFLLLLIGIVTTVLFQSSSAITSLVLAMAMSGVVIGGTGNGVLFLILGTNIGSTSTALLSAIGSTVNGKRSAVIHLLFNVFGSVLFFILLLCWPNFNELTFQRWFADQPQFQISMFHTFFNLACTLIFFPFINIFVKLATWIVPDKQQKISKQEDEIIDDRFLTNTAIAFSQCVKYYHLIAGKALNDLNLAIDAFIDKDEAKKKQIDAIQNEVLRMSRNLTSYIVKVVSAGVNEEANIRLSKMQLDIADIIRLTEVADNITGYTMHEIRDNLSFSPIVYEQIRTMKDMLNRQFANADKITETPSLVLFVASQKLEDDIDNLRTEMIKSHMDRLAVGECKPENSNVFVNLVGNLERCGDHFNFICERACDKSQSAHA
jgi:phosphate:Na+ symporter